MRRANAAARAAFGAEIAAVLRHPGLRARDRPRLRPGAAAQTAELALPVPVPREVHATVVCRWTRRWPMAASALVVLSDRTRERAVERMRADFVANASHELRTPLASLIGFIDTLRGPAADDPPAQQRFLGIMAEQARADEPADRRPAQPVAHRTDRAPAAVGAVDLAELVARIAAGFEPRLAERAR